MKNIYCFLIATLCHFAAFAQQDAMYSQYTQNQFIINPAYAGTYNMFNATAVSRLQWAGLAGAPLTNTVTGHSALYKNRLGAGILLSNDRFGINSNTEMAGTLAYKIRLSDNDSHVLSFGMQAGLVNYNYGYNDLTVKYTDDPNLSVQAQASTMTNFGAGVFYRNEKMYAGLSAPKMLDKEVKDGKSSAVQYRKHLFLTGGYLFDFNSVIFKPSFLVRYVDGSPVSFDLSGAVLLKEVVWLGASLRNLNSTVLLAQLQISDNMRLGYSIDIPLTSVIRASYGTHELMLNIDMKLLKSHDVGMRYF